MFIYKCIIFCTDSVFAWILSSLKNFKSKRLICLLPSCRAESLFGTCFTARQLFISSKNQQFSPICARLKCGGVGLNVLFFSSPSFVSVFWLRADVTALDKAELISSWLICQSCRMKVR